MNAQEIQKQKNKLEWDIADIKSVRDHVIEVFPNDSVLHSYYDRKIAELQAQLKELGEEGVPAHIDIEPDERLRR
jgi:hypothetical protein